jgi:hypothetical protein
LNFFVFINWFYNCHFSTFKLSFLTFGNVTIITRNQSENLSSFKSLYLSPIGIDSNYVFSKVANEQSSHWPIKFLKANLKCKKWGPNVFEHVITKWISILYQYVNRTQTELKYNSVNKIIFFNCSFSNVRLGFKWGLKEVKMIPGKKNWFRTKVIKGVAW